MVSHIQGHKFDRNIKRGTESSFSSIKNCLSRYVTKIIEINVKLNGIFK